MFTIIEGKPLESVLDSTARINIWAGAVRSSKTVHSLIRWIEYTQTAPSGGQLIMAAKTEATLERNIFSVLSEMLGKDFSYSRGNHTWRIGDRTGFSIGANDVQAEGKIRGLTASGIYIDEATLIPQTFWNQALARLSVRGAKLFATTNPDSPYHWLKTDFIDRQAELNLKHFTWSIDANTTLDPEYVSSLKAEYKGLWYKRFIDGLWVMAEGAIYDFFDEEQHCISELPRADWKFAACDYGTSNATAAGIFGVCNNPQSGQPRVWLEREYYHSGRDSGSTKTDAQYAAEIKAWLEGENIREFVLDPSAASFRGALQAVGIPTRDADNDVLNGIRTVSSMMHTGLFKIHKSCLNTIKSVSGYMWDRKAQERGEDKPLKVNDHACDKVRYGLYTNFGDNVSRANVRGGRM